MRIRITPLLLTIAFLAAGVRAPAKDDAFPKEVVTACLEAQPAPPAPDSLAALADLETVREVQAWRTQAQVDFARRIDAGSLFEFSDVLGSGFTAARLPQCGKLLERLDAIAGQVSSKAKHRFPRLRPPYTDLRVKPCIEAPPRASSSYPSGHATLFTLGALALAEVFPDQREALLAWGRKAAWSRVIAGVHFPSDVAGGRLLAEGIFARLKQDPEFQATVARCREEVAACLPRKAA
ncbi:MAG TPA: phosphatase PAP2 family protein [Holophaga sp.]|nr:phosphatase PAP2 family protein [Holophaga sp.]